MINSFFLFLIFAFISPLHAKEMALSFDDAPMDTSTHYESVARTNELIRKLNDLGVPPVMIFANPCKREDAASVMQQLKKYLDHGHDIANHTCSHPRLDEVGFVSFASDAEKADKLLAPLFEGQKFFRFPFLNEGKDRLLRDQMREWLKEHHYRNGMVSIDTDDYVFSFKINQAKQLGKRIDYKKVETLFVNHVVESASFYDDLAQKILGRSPKHILLLHEMDATVLFMDSLVTALRHEGWVMVSAKESYEDPVYLENPKNTAANNGILAQVAFEKTGRRIRYGDSQKLERELDKILGL